MNLTLVLNPGLVPKALGRNLVDLGANTHVRARIKSI